jgi:hypothetical protein
VSSVLPVMLFALGGVLLGGAWSLRRQGAPLAAALVLALLAVLALVAAVLRLVYG